MRHFLVLHHVYFLTLTVTFLIFEENLVLAGFYGLLSQIPCYFSEIFTDIPPSFSGLLIGKYADRNDILICLCSSITFTNSGFCKTFLILETFRRLFTNRKQTVQHLIYISYFARPSILVCGLFTCRIFSPRIGSKQSKYAITVWHLT